MKPSVAAFILDQEVFHKVRPEVAGMITGAESPAELLEKRNKIAHEATQRYVDLWNYDGTKITDSIRKSFDAQRRMLDPENARAYVAMLRRAADIIGADKVLIVSHSQEVIDLADARIEIPVDSQTEAA